MSPGRPARPARAAVVAPGAARGSARRLFWAIVPAMAGTPEQLLIALAHQRGLTLDEERAAMLRPLLESLLTRLSRIGGADRPGLVPPPDHLGEPAP